MVNSMTVQVLGEAGYEFALLGLTLSRHRPIEEAPQIAAKLFQKGDEEAKFLRHIDIWLDVRGPRYFWMQMAEYRIGQGIVDGLEWQSESTMYGLMERPLQMGDFAPGADIIPISFVDKAKEMGDFETAKKNLPEGYLQRRIVKTNYQVIRRIAKQRWAHRLPEWKAFIEQVLGQLEHREFLVDLVEVWLNVP